MLSLEIDMKTYFKRLFLIAIILSSSVGCDQITKIAAKNHLSSTGTMSFWGDTFRLQYIENNGAFLSLGATLPTEARFWLFIVLTIIAVAGMLTFVLLHRNLRPSLVTGLSFVIGGGVGNLIDRVLHNGAVTDFMNVGIGSLRTGIFNVADMVIMLGTGLLIFAGSQKRVEH